jgi:hypothetical protein
MLCSAPPAALKPAVPVARHAVDARVLRQCGRDLLLRLVQLRAVDVQHRHRAAGRRELLAEPVAPVRQRHVLLLVDDAQPMLDPAEAIAVPASCPARVSSWPT